MEAEIFAKSVHERAMNPIGSRPTVAITVGILMQLFWIGVILFACWFLSAGSIIVWWCTVSFSRSPL